MLHLWPQLHREPGPFVWSGKCVPESGPGVGHAFRNGYEAETTSQNQAPDWDALSGTALNRKLHPRIEARNGMNFPFEPVAESMARNFASEWDAVSARGLIRKACPILSVQSGTQFPLGMPSGKCVPFRAPILGHAFRGCGCWKSVSQIDKMRRGNAWHNSPYRSTSLSHVGRAVCLTPAVCSFFASTPAERTSFMVKRMSGWP